MSINQLDGTYLGNRMFFSRYFLRFYGDGLHNKIISLLSTVFLIRLSAGYYLWLSKYTVSPILHRVQP